MAKLGGIYSRNSLWALFVLITFPVHVWALIMVFKDISWLADRTNNWDALGVVSYALIFALLETIVILTFLVVLGFLLPYKWGDVKRVAVISVFAYVIFLWAIIYRLSYFSSIDPFMLQWITTIRNWQVLLIAGLIIVGISFIIPMYLSARLVKIHEFILKVSERLSVLVALYLFLDLIGLLIVIYRNL